ncbi:Arc family DNA-binding protein [Shinella sp.]|uniref:Arc family DNA-binding protein n=1 Tax=Shinella sp. TaxID=1870904 RepID=UPI00301E1D7C
MKDTPAKDLDKFVLRLPDGLRERVKASADMNNRSMNAEIVAALEKAIADEESLASGEPPVVFSERILARIRDFIDERANDPDFLKSLVTASADEKQPPQKGRDLSEQAGAAALAHIIELRNICGDLRAGLLSDTAILAKTLNGYLLSVKSLVEIMEYQVGGETTEDLKRELSLTKTLIKSVTHFLKNRQH